MQNIPSQKKRVVFFSGTFWFSHAQFFIFFLGHYFWFLGCKFSKIFSGKKQSFSVNFWAVFSLFYRAFFFSGKRWGQSFFSLSDLFFSVVMRGTTSFKKINLTFCLGAGECISAQQSPIRHISRRVREGAGLLIS